MERAREALPTVDVADIEGLVQELLTGLEPLEEEPSGPGRPRVLPAVCLWAGLLVCVLRGFSSQLAVWRLLSQEGLWYYPRFPISDEAVYRRLAQDDGQTMAWLFTQITELLTARLEPGDELAPFAQDVLAIDETTLDPVARTLPPLRAAPAGDAQLLPGKLAGLFDVRRQLWRRVAYVADARQNERVMARSLLESVTPGSLVLMDRGYFSFAWFDALTEAGVYWITRLRRGTSYEPVHVYYHNDTVWDGIVWLGKHRADRAKHAVRLIWVHQHGRAHTYLSNVLDPRQLPAAELVPLYARRWDFEMAVQLVKQHLKLRLLWSAKPTVILQQIWGVLIIAQILQALRCEIAQRAGCDLFEVSMPLLVEYVPRWAAAGTDPLALILERGRAMGLIRPSRRTPRPGPPVDPAELVPLPDDCVLQRIPRYAQRKCRRGEN